MFITACHPAIIVIKEIPDQKDFLNNQNKKKHTRATKRYAKNKCKQTKEPPMGGVKIFCVGPGQEQYGNNTVYGNKKFFGEPAQKWLIHLRNNSLVMVEESRKNY